MKVKVRCIKKYYDLELSCTIEPDPKDENYERIITKVRADEIIQKTKGAIKIVKTDEVETAKQDTTNSEKAIRKTTSKKKISKQ